MKEIARIKNDKTGKVHAVIRTLITDGGGTYITACNLKDVTIVRYSKVQAHKPITCIHCLNALAKKKVIVRSKPQPIVYIMVNDDGDEATVTKNPSKILDELQDYYACDDDILSELEDGHCEFKFYKAVEMKAVAVTESTRTITKLTMEEK